ncbi:hypothetical protein EQ836_00270 [Ectopseudomonas mendocina]|uniref:Uncharacterized protein n=1 Tax=Ectopseudomonas mendocina TaxID=300 RepID=A0ABD7S364_ECTME|nr:hypothetical protein EQ829_03270 [Pseudomonas mendocina]TRO21628.1 hypothetical protein EQ836_00270 [Pseudomonas mendocina]
MLAKLLESTSLSLFGPVPSLPKRPVEVIVTALSSVVLKVSSTATGASFTAATFMVTVATLL